MDIKQIEELVKIIEASSLTEFTYKDKDVKITMSKLNKPPFPPMGPGMPFPPGHPKEEK